jgi:AcrR family transcriptional regulator
LHYDFALMGRPRSEEARQAALAATVDLVLAHGVEGVTFEDVAARSGVAKTTLYRHFGTKQALVVAAASSCLVEHPTPDTGDLAADLRSIFDRFKEAEDERRLPDILPALVAASDRDPDLHDLVVAMRDERRRPIRTVLQLAQLRGEIGRDVDLDAAMALLIGPFVMKRMIDREEVAPEFLDAVFEMAIAGLRATASGGVPALARR